MSSLLLRRTYEGSGSGLEQDLLTYNTYSLQSKTSCQPLRTAVHRHEPALISMAARVS